MASTNSLKKQIENGKMLVIAELLPPRDGNPEVIREQSTRLKGKVHAVGLSDNRDGVGMSAVAAAALASGAGMDTIVHMVTRDRNRIALESDFLGARALGLTNILCTTGTHQTLGDFKSAKNVFDVDSVQLIKLLAGHAAANGSTCLGGTASPFADPMELQVMRLAKKISLGVSFVVTQPVFDLKRFETWWGEVKKKDIQKKTAILVGIRPLLSRDAAAAYAAERPNPRIPTEMLGRITGAASDAEARKEGISQAVATIGKIKAMAGIRGFEISCGSDLDATLEILQKAGLGI